MYELFYEQLVLSVSVYRKKLPDLELNSWSSPPEYLTDYLVPSNVIVCFSVSFELG